MTMKSEHDVWMTINERLQKAGLLILGEMHGASVNPRIISEFVRRLNISSVFIEVDKKYAKLLKKITIKNVSATAVAIKKSDAWLFEAGVLSIAHLRLYAQFNERGIRVVPIKVEDKNWNRAEKKTAIEIKKNLTTKSQNTLLIVGNLHARKKIFGEYRPLGWLLHDAVHVLVRYGKGAIYNFGLIKVSDTSALRMLKKDAQALRVSRGSFFDFEYLVAETKPL